MINNFLLDVFHDKSTIESNFLIMRYMFSKYKYLLSNTDNYLIYKIFQFQFFIYLKFCVKHEFMLVFRPLTTQLD